MNSETIHNIISSNTRTWIKNPKNKKILLKGQQLEDALEFLKSEDANFLLKSEREYIETSFKNSRKKRFLYTIIFLSIIGGAGYYVTTNGIYLDKILENSKKLLEVKNESNISNNNTIITKKDNIDEIVEEINKKEKRKEENPTEKKEATIKETEEIVKKEPIITPKTSTKEINQIDMDFNKIVNEVLAEKDTTLSKKLLLTAFKKAKNQDEKRLINILYNNLTSFNVIKNIPIEKEVDRVLRVDKNRFFAYNKSGYITLIDINSGKKYSINVGNLKKIEIVPNLKMFATLLENGKVILWYLNSGRKYGTFINKKAEDVSFNNKSTLMLIAGDNGKVSMWGLKRKKRIRNFKHKEDVKEAKFNFLANQIMTVSGNNVIFWSKKRGKILITIKTGEPIKNAILTKNSKRVLTISDKKVMLWSTNRGKTLLNLKAKSGDFISANFSSDERYIITTNNSNEVIIYDMRGKPIFVQKFETPIEEATLSKNNKYLLVTTEKKILLYNRKNSNKLLEVEAKGDSINGSFVNNEEEILINNGEEIKLYSINQNKKLYNIKDEEIKKALSINGKIISIDKKSIKVWDKSEKIKEESLEISGKIPFILNDKMDKIVVYGKGKIRIFNRSNMRKPVIFKHSFVKGVDISDDKLVSYSKKEIIVWSLMEKDKEFIIKAKKSETFKKVFFNQDKTILIVISDRVILYKFTKDSMINIATIEKKDVNSVSLSSNNRELIVVSNEQFKVFKDIEKREGFIIHSKNSTDAIFNQKGDKFYTLANNNIKVWNIYDKSDEASIDCKAQKIKINREENLLLAIDQNRVTIIDLKYKIPIFSFATKKEIIDAKFNETGDTIIAYDKSATITRVKFYNKNIEIK